jgi:MATE family multidrug resistance protein
MTACTQLLLVGVLVLGRHVIGALFTNIPEVLAMCAATFPLVSASMFGDGLNSTISGVLRGAGRQQLGAMLNLASYWGLGLPTAYLLSVKAGLELKGLWGGLILATSVQVSVMRCGVEGWGDTKIRVCWFICLATYCLNAAML